MSDAISLYGEGIPDDEFEKFKDELKKGMLDIKNKFKKWSATLGKMTRPQVNIIKKTLKEIGIQTNTVECMVLHGRGMLAEHWVFSKTMRASVFKYLPEKERKKLNDPNRTVELLTKSGVTIKPLKELSSIELNQVVDPKVGILPAEQQQKRMLGPSPKQKKVDTVAEQAYVFDGFNVTSEGDVLMYARDSASDPGARQIEVRIPKKQWNTLR